MANQTVGLEDFIVGVDRLVEAHGEMVSKGHSEPTRFRLANNAMVAVDFTPNELRGMLAVAVERLTPKEGTK